MTAQYCTYSFLCVNGFFLGRFFCYAGDFNAKSRNSLVYRRRARLFYDKSLSREKISVGLAFHLNSRYALNSAHSKPQKQVPFFHKIKVSREREKKPRLQVKPDDTNY